ncbi:mitochondrial protein Pet127-domain-containing protein, partial [Lasiosphaeria miniovina]
RFFPDTLRLDPVEKPQPPVPRLSYGLDRVLFNPGVYQLQDPRSRVFNFDPYLARIMPAQEFDFDALKQFVSSSKDKTLHAMASELGKRYSGSTSSMTAALSHFHFLLSSWRPISTKAMSQDFEVDSEKFTKITRAPAASFLHYKDGVYAIDADKEFDMANLLSLLGKSMEKLLTLPKEEFEKYRKTKSDQLTHAQRNDPEAYHYTTMGDFMMRSQLDAYDPRVPGTGMFDLKTRAVVSIRMDIQGIKKGANYEIRGRLGQWESFEREYYDMIRSAFLKYSLQVRMGRMDGIFVAFHNTERIFGFQYISLPEMDQALHGTTNTDLGDQEFKASLHLYNEALNLVTKEFPEQSLRIHVETREGDPPSMRIFARPVTNDEIESIQGAQRRYAEEFEREIMNAGLGSREDAGPEAVEGDTVVAETEDTASQDVWKDVMLEVEHTLEDQEQGVTAVREAIEYALEHSGLLHSCTSDEAGHHLDELLEALLTSGGEVVTEGSEGQPQTSEVRSSLKELLLKLAAQGKAVSSIRQTEQQIEDDVTDDSIKLRNFETILSELAETARDSGNLAEPSYEQDDGTLEMSPTEIPQYNGPLCCFALTVKNKDQRIPIERPTGHADEKWSIEYAFDKLSDGRARMLYKHTLARRAKEFQAKPTELAKKSWYAMWSGLLSEYNDKGRKYRDLETARGQKHPVHVYGIDTPLDWESVMEGPAEEPYRLWNG